MTVRPTDRPELELLMTNEFHQPGLQDFVRDQLDHYVQRLSGSQLDVLDQLPAHRLTAFITFGDGYFDRPMVADFSDTKRDNVRPNASFALFRRMSSTEIHLVYYTRFFTVSYAGLKGVRADCHRFDATNVPARRQTLKKQIYGDMRRIPVLRGYFTPTDRSHQRRLRLRLDTRGFFQDLSGGYSTWIVLEELKRGRWIVPDWLKGKPGYNTIHGMINTAGCWMFQRNFLFEWPNEIGPTGNARLEIYAKAFVASRRLNDWPQHYNQAFNLSLSDADAYDLRNAAVNPAYLEFLRAFIGLLPSAFRLPEAKFPPGPLTVLAGTVDELEVALPSSVTDYYAGGGIRFDSGTSTVVLQAQQGAIDGSVPLGRGSTRLRLRSPLPAAPAVGDELAWGSAFLMAKPRNVEFGPNAFGDTFDRKVFARDLQGGQGFADVYLWQQTSGFTSLDGTTIEAW